MVEDPGIDTSKALEDIVYLARSDNRVKLLDELHRDSYTRRDLTELTGIPRTTVGRILNEFQERGWVERMSEGEYSATPTGEQVIIEFSPLVDSMAVIRKLGEMVAWFREAGSNLDLHYLSDAFVRRPDTDDLMAPTSTYIDDLRNASEFYGVVGIAAPVRLEKAMRDGVVEGALRVDQVISDNLYSYLLDDPARMTRRRENIEAGANIYRFGGDVPFNLFVLDETVYIGNTQSEYGEPYTVIVSENEVVRSWAREIFEEFRVDSEKLSAEDFV